MRPTLDGYVGQEDAVGPGSWLCVKKLLKARYSLVKILLYGPAGTLSKDHACTHYCSYNARRICRSICNYGAVKDLREIEAAESRLLTAGRRTIFVHWWDSSFCALSARCLASCSRENQIVCTYLGLLQKTPSTLRLTALWISRSCRWSCMHCQMRRRWAHSASASREDGLAGAFVLDEDARKERLWRLQAEMVARP